MPGSRHCSDFTKSTILYRITTLYRSAPVKKPVDTTNHQATNTLHTTTTAVTMVTPHGFVRLRVYYQRAEDVPEEPQHQHPNVTTVLATRCQSTQVT